MRSTKSRQQMSDLSDVLGLSRTNRSTSTLIAGNIRHRMRELDITKNQAARAMGIPAPTFQNYMTGASMPMAKLSAIAKALKTTATKLTKETARG